MQRDTIPSGSGQQIADTISPAAVHPVLGYPVKTIRHDHRDDAAMALTLERAWRARSAASQPVGRFGHCVLQATSWPSREAPPYFFFVIEGRPVGFAVLRDRPNGTGTLGVIHLLPEARKQGYGLALYRFLLDHGVCLRPDDHQTLAGQGMWTRLASEYPFTRDTQGPIALPKGSERVFVEASAVYTGDDALRVTGYLDGVPVGHALFHCTYGDPPTATAAELQVDPDARRRGVATAMCERVAAEGWSPRPGEGLTDATAAFWASRLGAPAATVPMGPTP